MQHNYFTLFINKDWGLKLGNKMSKGKKKYHLDGGGVHYLFIRGFYGHQNLPAQQWKEES
jgi:hypothetical protein